MCKTNNIIQPIKSMGYAFTRNCMRENSLIKLSTIKQRNLNQYYRLLDIYSDLKKKIMKKTSRETNPFLLKNQNIVRENILGGVNPNDPINVGKLGYSQIIYKKNNRYYD